MSSGFVRVVADFGSRTQESGRRLGGERGTERRGGRGKPVLSFELGLHQRRVWGGGGTRTGRPRVYRGSERVGRKSRVLRSVQTQRGYVNCLRLDYQVSLHWKFEICPTAAEHRGAERIPVPLTQYSSTFRRLPFLVHRSKGRQIRQPANPISEVNVFWTRDPCSRPLDKPPPPR